MVNENALGACEVKHLIGSFFERKPHLTIGTDVNKCLEEIKLPVSSYSVLKKNNGQNINLG